MLGKCSRICEFEDSSLPHLVCAPPDRPPRRRKQLTAKLGAAGPATAPATSRRPAARLRTRPECSFRFRRDYMTTNAPAGANPESGLTKLRPCNLSLPRLTGGKETSRRNWPLHPLGCPQRLFQNFPLIILQTIRGTSGMCTRGAKMESGTFANSLSARRTRTPFPGNEPEWDRAPLRGPWGGVWMTV